MLVGKNQHFFIFLYSTLRFNYLNILNEMQLRLLNRHHTLFDVNEDGTANNDGGSDNNTTDTPDTSKDDAGNKKEGNTSIPKARFDEINEKYKAAKAELDKINADKQKAEEQEALKRGEHEKLIAQKDQELADYKAKEEIWKAREISQTDTNNARVEKLKTAYGDKWANVSNLLDANDDPFKTAKTLDVIESMLPSKTDGEHKPTAPKGGSDVPGGNNQGRLAELKAKAERGERLSDRERKELYDLIEGK